MNRNVRCPYCGYTIAVELTDNLLIGTKQLRWCDPEDGGCDKELVFEVGFEVRMSYFTLEALEGDHVHG